MGVTTRLIQGDLNTTANPLSVTIDKGDIIVDDTNVSYSGFTSLKKKILITDNECKNGETVDNLAYESPASTAISTSWTYQDFIDGWFTVYLIGVDGYNNTIPTNANREKGLIIYYENSSTGLVGDFYVDKVGTGTDKPDTSGTTDWELAKFTDYTNFVRMIENRTDLAQTFIGEYGMEQDLLIYTLDICKIDKALKLIDCDCEPKDDCSDCSTADYTKLDLKLYTAEKLFCQDRFRQAQEVIQTAWDLCGDCNIC